MYTTIKNTTGKSLSDKFDTLDVSSLSLVLYNHLYVLFLNDKNNQILGVHWEVKKNIQAVIKAVTSLPIFSKDLPLSVYYHSEFFALVPGVIYEPAQNDTFLHFASPTLQDHVSFNTSLESNNLQLIGAIPQEVAQLLSSGKQEVTLHHAAASFLSLALKEKFNLLNQEIWVSIQTNFLYLAAFKDQELVLFNRFEATTEQIILQYIYGIAHKLSFDPKLFRLTIFESEFNKLPVSWGTEYFKNIKITVPVCNQLYHQGADEFKQTGIFESSWIFN
ncbi:DUF3822 family protein [Mongoliitalea daihaiensis]|uniref:DUF3822 family protein n=1 Tax=Mongoliitalea daihaiensis TaxID=2782006 RepID=UPI001F1DF29D|nr:DUF3822 family protein [Mongoliitalea daihaiensis]UJP63584.1 DUF3822 family protein [Mongoliitalea daihaiensis]